MKPAFSVITLTAAAGAAQGLVVAVALATLTHVPLAPGSTRAALLSAAVLLLGGLAASFLHLGRPERAWRAAAMWRTSWLSREVIVLPALLGVVLLWWGLSATGGPAAGAAPSSEALQVLTHRVLPLLALAGCAALWLCTAQIYACLRFIQEWAHPLTLVNYVLVGLASGLMLGCALAAILGDRALLAELGPRALAATLAAWGTRTAALRRNARLKPVSTLQSATGLRAERVVQKSMGMTGGAFNTREFFHGASQAAIRHVRLALHGLCFGIPAACLALAMGSSGAGGAAWWWLALALHVPGLLAERWLFFAQARHPQNLYYQAVS